MDKDLVTLLIAFIKRNSPPKWSSGVQATFAVRAVRAMSNVDESRILSTLGHGVLGNVSQFQQWLASKECKMLAGADYSIIAPYVRVEKEKLNDSPGLPDLAAKIEQACPAGTGGAPSRLTVMNPDVRWKQRFQNFDRAYGLLRQALERGPGALNQLEKEGVARRFEYCFELAWKTAKDFLEVGGIRFATITPRHVLKEAFTAKLIADGQVWVDMLDQRNLLSHTYDFRSFEKAVAAIGTRYLPAMTALHEFFREESLK